MLPAINILLDEVEDSDEETMAEATFHKFDESTGKTTNESTHQTTNKTTDGSTDRTTEVTQIDSFHQIVLVLNLK